MIASCTERTHPEPPECNTAQNTPDAGARGSDSAEIGRGHAATGSEGKVVASGAPISATPADATRLPDTGGGADTDPSPQDLLREADRELLRLVTEVDGPDVARSIEKGMLRRAIAQEMNEGDPPEDPDLAGDASPMPTDGERPKSHRDYLESAYGYRLAPISPETVVAGYAIGASRVQCSYTGGTHGRAEYMCMQRDMFRLPPEEAGAAAIGIAENTLSWMLARLSSALHSALGAEEGRIYSGGWYRDGMPEHIRDMANTVANLHTHLVKTEAIRAQSARRQALAAKKTPKRGAGA